MSCVHYLARFGILILRWPCVVDRTSKSSLYFGLFRHAMKYPLENPCLAIVRMGTHGKPTVYWSAQSHLCFLAPGFKTKWHLGQGQHYERGHQWDRVSTVNRPEVGQGQHCEWAVSGTGSAVWMGHQCDRVTSATNWGVAGEQTMHFSSYHCDKHMVWRAGQ